MHVLKCKSSVAITRPDLSNFLANTPCASKRPENILKICGPTRKSQYFCISVAITCVVYFSESHSSGQLIVSYSWGLINRESLSPVLTALHNSTYIGFFLNAHNIYFKAKYDFTIPIELVFLCHFLQLLRAWGKLVNIGKCAGNDLEIGGKKLTCKW